MTEQIPQTIAAAASAIRAGDLTSAGLTSALLDRIGQLDPDLGAFVTVSRERATEAAARADAELSAGRDRGLLHGIPLAVKDIISTREMPTFGNSRVTDQGWGNGTDAPAVRRLRSAGAVVIGKTTTNEFASGLGDPSKGFPEPRNPWDSERTPAGSSSGSGIAVAAGMALGALGTDTGGSVRAPAAAVGISGLKPSHGRVPKSGVIPLGYSQDTVGPMARSAMDCALLLEVLAGADASDPSASDVRVPRYAQLLTGSVEGTRVGVPARYFFDSPELDPQYRDAVIAAIDLLGDHGAVVVDTEVPLARESRDASTLLWICDGYAYHRRNLLTRWSDYGRPTRTLLAQAAFYSAADYVQAQRVQNRFRSELARIFADIDVLIVPSALGVAERFSDMKVERRRLGPNFLAQWSLAGNPVIAIPCGFGEGGLPCSLQVVGPAFGEAAVLRVADAYQRLTSFHLRRPPRPSAATDKS